MIARALLLATALLASCCDARARADPKRRHRSTRAARQRAGVGRSRADRRHHRQCRQRRADRDLPRAGSRHHGLAAGGAGAQHPSRPPRDRRRHPRPEGNFGHPSGPHAREQGHRTAGRPRAGAPQRPWRRRQSQHDLRPRSRRRQAGGQLHRRHAGGDRALRQPQRPLRHHLRNRQRERRGADKTALHRHGGRDRRGRGAGAQCRTQ